MVIEPRMMPFSDPENDSGSRGRAMNWNPPRRLQHVCRGDGQIRCDRHDVAAQLNQAREPADGIACEAGDHCVNGAGDLGNLPDSSAEIRQTQNGRRRRSARSRRRPGPPRAKPQRENANTSSRSRRNEKPDANAAYRRWPRCNSACTKFLQRGGILGRNRGVDGGASYGLLEAEEIDK